MMVPVGDDRDHTCPDRRGMGVEGAGVRSR